MGSFTGHIIPGLFFVLFGAWGTFQNWRLYIKSFTPGGKSFQCLAHPRVDFKRCTFSVEAVLVVFCAVIGIVIELRGLFMVKVWGPPGAGNWQHATMYLFFGIFGLFLAFSSVLERLLVYQFDHTKYMLGAMAFAVEAILFKFHLSGRDSLDVVIHTLLVYTVFACAFFTILEMLFNTHVLTSLARNYFMILQGTWFWQVGFILYNPVWPRGYDPWDHEDHHQVMLATCMYTWHMGGAFLASLACGLGCAWYYRKKGLLNLAAENEDQVS